MNDTEFVQPRSLYEDAVRNTYSSPFNETFIFIKGMPDDIMEEVNSYCQSGYTVDIIKFRESIEDSYGIIKITKI